MSLSSPHKRSLIAILDEIAMMTLAMLSALLLFIEMTLRLTPVQLVTITHVDLIIALIFMIEFTIRLHLSSDTLQFLRKYWWEILAAIPISNEVTQALRMLRLLRLLRVAIHLRVFWRNDKRAPEYTIT